MGGGTADGGEPNDTRGGAAATTSPTGPGWSDLVGPVLTPGATAQLLGLSTSQVSARRRRSRLLGVKVGRRWVYPIAQFKEADGEPSVVPGLREVLEALRPVGDSLAAARWLATPNRRLDGATPWTALTGTADARHVIDAAHAQAESYAIRPLPR